MFVASVSRRSRSRSWFFFAVACLAFLPAASPVFAQEGATEPGETRAAPSKPEKKQKRRNPLRRLLRGILENQSAPKDFPEEFLPLREGDFNARKIADLDYYAGEDYDKDKHKLNLFVPEPRSGAKPKNPWPVMMFVHGGSWRSGDREYKADLLPPDGVYSRIGRAFARAGVLTAVISYRLSPKVKHPEHEKDVARAFAWLHGNVAKYRGDPGAMFITGHSAGAHLVSLLATDPKYLEAHDLSPANIAGVISLSGPLRLTSGLFSEVFGKDPAALADASPINHVSANSPPFLVAWGDTDLPTLDVAGKQMKQKLDAVGVPCSAIEISNRTHYTIVMYLGAARDEQLTPAVLDFIRDRTRQLRGEKTPATAPAPLKETGQDEEF